MSFNFKNFKILKIRNFVKKNKLFFFAFGVNKNSSDWIGTEQGFKKIQCKYYKIFNKSANKVLSNSIFLNSKDLIGGTTFFINPQKEQNALIKKSQLKELNPLLFSVLACKINNKIYSAKQYKRTTSLEYIENKLILYKFCSVSLKSYIQLNSNKALSNTI